MPRSATPYGILPRPEFQITPEVLQKCEEAAATGLTQGQVAVVLGIHPTTLINKKKEYPQLSEAYERGRAKAVAKVENALFVNATNPAYGKDGSPTGPPAGSIDAQKFFLKTRAGYKENDTTTVNIVIPPLFSAKVAPEADSMFEPRKLDD